MVDRTRMPAVPAAPIDQPPVGFHPNTVQRQLLLDALTGVELGAHDERIVQWLAGWDWPTVATIVSLVHRAAAAPTTYRAEYEHAITPLETYTTRAEARKHCETEAREEEGRERADFDLVWQPASDDEVEELWVGTGPDDAERTGYLVRARTIATAYDPEATS